LRTREDRADVEVELETWERILSLLSDAKSDDVADKTLNE
jgi:hypothetical protein